MLCEQQPWELKDYIRDRVAQPEMTMMDEQKKRNGNGRNKARSYLHSPHFLNSPFTFNTQLLPFIAKFLSRLKAPCIDKLRQVFSIILVIFRHVLVCV